MFLQIILNVLKLIASKEYVDSYFYKVKENKLVEAGDLKYGKLKI